MPLDALFSLHERLYANKRNSRCIVSRVSATGWASDTIGLDRTSGNEKCTRMDGSALFLSCIYGMVPIPPDNVRQLDGSEAEESDFDSEAAFKHQGRKVLSVTRLLYDLL